MRYDLVSLKIFAAVAECRNLTRAAKREHLAVSAVSKRIAELEAITGTPLLVRYPRGVSLTPAGQALLRHARQMLQLVDRMSVEMSEFADGVKGRVHMHVVASALSQYLPRELEEFLGQHPGVRVAVEEHTGKSIVAAVADGTADLGVIARRTPAPGLALLPYHTDRLAIGVPLQHPLARRKAARFAEALDHVFVCPHADSVLALLMDDEARACGKAIQHRVQASSFDAVCRLVQSRLGITLLPEGVMQPHVDAGRIRVIRLNEPWALLEMCLVIRKEEAQIGHLTRSLVDHLRRSALEMAAS